MSKRDYYEVLGVSRDAGQEEIKRAYRRLALELHPDKHPGNKEVEERFKEINEAYAVLSDPEKRMTYDRYGTVSPPGPVGFEDFDLGFGSVFEDLFEGFFGTGARRRTAAERGADLRYNLEISLEEAAFGTEREIIVPRLETCPSCRGTGARGGAQPSRCRICQGTGQVRYTRGFLTVAQTCSACRGEGFVVEHPCPECRGTGRAKVERALSLKIPPGVETGTRLKIAGEGEAGFRGGPRGDLYVVVTVKEHPLFTRRGTDLFCEVPVSFVQAALGAKLQVPTLHGMTTLKIPPGTQSGTEFRLEGKGLPSLKGYRHGDLIVRVIVEVPTHLTPKQRQLLEEFAKLQDGHGTPMVTSFLEKVKNLFG